MPEVNSPASASPSMLAGMSNSANSNGASPNTSDSTSQGGSQQSPNGGAAGAKLNNDIQTLRAMESSLLELGQSYPTASKVLRTASEAIRSAQRQIVSSPGMAEPPVPNTTA